MDGTASNLAALTDGYAECARGMGRTVLVTGGLAAGKTRLLNTFTRRVARSGALVLTAAGSRAERRVRYGILDQLVRSAPLTGDLPDRIAAPGQAGTDVEPTALRAADAALIQSAGRAILDSARNRPVVVCVDDVQFADAASLQALLYLHRRVGAERVMLVLTTWSHPRETQPGFRTELSRYPHFRQVRIGPLSCHEVTRILADRLDIATGRALAPACHRFTSGNPLLVNAIADDLRAGHGTDRLVVGASYGRAVSFCLHRWEHRLARVGHGLAVLGGAATAELTARLTNVDLASVVQVTEILTGAGIVADQRLRHEAARRALLDSLDPQRRADLHARAAALLYSSEQATPDIAAQLVAADRADEPWAATVLSGAADQFLTRRQPGLAERCLDLALRGEADGRDRVRWRGALARWRRREAQDPNVSRTRPATDPWAQAVTAARVAFAAGTTAQQVRAAEQCLRDGPPDGWAPALLTLLYSDRADLAGRWYRTGDPAGDAAALATIGAEISLRQGRLSMAVGHAEDALARLGPDDRLAAAPLAVLISAASFAGRHDEAERLVRQPVPDSVFETVAGLGYLHARGHHFLATGRPLAALGEFHLCGQLADAWRMDLPSFVPWRCDLAQAHLRLADFEPGHAEAARRLASAQLAMPGAAGARTRGMSLRILAAAAEPDRQAGPLHESVRLLRKAGDETELRRALADLNRVRRHLPNGASPSRPPTTPPAGPEPDSAPGNGSPDASILSGAEHRVAALAALGRTNREISQELYITVSTVEQHLTRVYRKLNVPCRDHLPAGLAAASGARG
jgi:DNA-binding CsgD family transcriptional regulator